MAREVLVNGVYQDKAGYTVDPKAQIEVKTAALPFVSRGGLKLAKAVEVFAVDFTNKINGWIFLSVYPFKLKSSCSL